MAVRVPWVVGLVGLVCAQAAAAPRKSGPASPDEILAEEAAKEDVRDELVAQYRVLIATAADDDPSKPEYLFQLADLLARRHRFHRLQSVGGPPGERAAHARAATKWLDEAVRAYTQAIPYKKYVRRDAVLFYLAHMLDKAGKTSDARVAYQLLREQHPGSRFLPDAYLAAADEAFAAGNMEDALAAYDTVIAMPTAKVAPYARYKRAWVLYNLGQLGPALGALVEVATAAAAAGKKQGTLERAARRDVVRVYAEIGKPATALALFRKIGKEAAARAMLTQLPDLYVERGRFSEAIVTWHELMKLTPKSPALCEWQRGVTRAQLALPGDEARVREMERLVALAVALRKGTVALPAAAGQACRQAAAEDAGQLSKLWHTETIDKQDNIVLAGRIDFVERLYRGWIDAFADDRVAVRAAEVAEMRAYAADVAWTRAVKESDPERQRARFAYAAAAYEAVARGGGAPDVVEDAAYNAVDGWARALAGRPRPNLPAGAPAAPLPDDQARLIGTYDLYVRLVPARAQKERERLALAKADVLFDYHHFDAAVPLFELVARTRKAPYAQAAARGLVDSLVALGRDDEVARAVKWMLEVRELRADAGLREALEKTDATTLIRLAERAARAGDHKACGDRYVGVLKKYPGDARMPELLAAAGDCYQSGGLLGAAIHLGEQLVGLAPQSREGVAELRRLGGRYARVGFFKSAADYYERFAEKSTDSHEAAAVMGDAAFFRRGVGQDDLALADGEAFVRRFGRKEAALAAEVMFGLRVVHARRGRAGDGALAKHLERYLREHGAAGGVDRRVVALVELGDARWRAACPVPGVDGACVSVVRGRAAVGAGGRVVRRREGWRPGLRCGAADARSRITLVGRRDDGVEAAAKAWRAAIAAGGGAAAPDPAREAALRAALARARFGLAEIAYERTLGLDFPDDLDFRPRREQESVARFLAWKSQRENAIVSALGLYRKVLELPGAGPWAIAATARAGQMYQSLADALITAEVPRPPRDVAPGEVQAFVDGYCDSLGEKTPAIDQLARAEFATCLEEAGKRSTFGSWSLLCEAELSRLDPMSYPPAVELRVEPRFHTTTTAYTDTIKKIR